MFDPPSAHNFVSVRAQNLNILIFNFIFLHCIYLLHLFQMFIVKSTENNLKVYMLLNYYANIIYTLAVLIKVKDRGILGDLDYHGRTYTSV